MVYGSDNDYVKLNAISDDGQGRVNRLELRSEVGGMVSATATDPQVTAAQAAGPIWLKLTKAGNSYTAEYKSTEAGAWIAFSARSPTRWSRRSSACTRRACCSPATP